jgi:hypothetical protein
MSVLASRSAAPEWQARSLGWHRFELVVVFPLEGLIRSVASPMQITGTPMESSVFHGDGRYGSRYR